MIVVTEIVVTVVLAVVGDKVVEVVVVIEVNIVSGSTRSSSNNDRVPIKEKHQISIWMNFSS